MIDFKVCYLKQNRGHGVARRKGLEECKNRFIALMDSDDISLPNRFERQLQVFQKNPNLHIVGGQIAEFIDNPSNIIGIRKVPESDQAIQQYMKKRCPMNQVSVMFQKDFVDQVGGYLDWYCEEDYYLWLRMALAGGEFANVPDTLVKVRVGDAMSARRGGWKYFTNEAKLQSYMLQNKVIGLPRYLYNVILRFCGEILLTNQIRTSLYKVMRKSPNDLKHTHNTESLQSDGEPIKKDHAVYPPFSVAMCVYGGDRADWFDTALHSVIDQTVQPNEIVLVVDGPVPNTIQSVIDKYAKICGGGGITFTVIRLKKNFGHGVARRTAFDQCKNEMIALMDADDICVPNRFEKQLACLCKGDIDVVGGDIAEFSGDVMNLVGYRRVPSDDVDIKRYAQKRCPFNQMTVMMKKTVYIQAGGYLDWYCNEDYYLWIRMMLHGVKFANIAEVLVYARVGKEMYHRRGGKQYFKSEAKFQRYLLQNQVISPPTYFVNVLKRFVVQILMPNQLRGWFFQKFAREK